MGTLKDTHKSNDCVGGFIQKKNPQNNSLYYDISHTLVVLNHLNRVKSKMKMLRKGDVGLPGALDAIFNTKNDRGDLWVKTGYCTTYITAYLEVSGTVKTYKISPLLKTLKGQSVCKELTRKIHCLQI